MRLATWNVNSIRTRVDRVLAFLQREEIDALAMQEIKCRPDQFPHDAFAHAGYELAVHGLDQWNGVAIPSDGQTRLRIEKLRHYRDEELRKLKVAEAQAGKTYVSQSQSQSQQASARAQSIVTVNLEETVEKIEELPESSLSEDDKVFLEGLMANLDAAAKKEKPSKKERLNKLLGFLTDKGVDVVIAVWPFIWNIIQKG